MVYLVWVVVGVLVALLLGSGPRRRVFQPTANAPLMAGAFGALIGGILLDGVPGRALGGMTALSIVGAVGGALLLCWAVRGRATDAEP